MVEEMPGPLVQNIQNLFYLPEELAKKYACIVFVACMRFETCKKKLQHLTFNNWRKCCEVIMEQWTYKMTSKSWNQTQKSHNWNIPLLGPGDYYDTEMDKEFLLELRELKVLLDREKDHKQ